MDSKVLKFELYNMIAHQSLHHDVENIVRAEHLFSGLKISQLNFSLCITGIATSTHKQWKLVSNIQQKNISSMQEAEINIGELHIQKGAFQKILVSDDGFVLLA